MRPAARGSHSPLEGENREDEHDRPGPSGPGLHGAGSRGHPHRCRQCGRITLPCQVTLAGTDFGIQAASTLIRPMLLSTLSPWLARTSGGFAFPPSPASSVPPGGALSFDRKGVQVTRLFTLDSSVGERDACGIGFVARLSGGPSRTVLDSLLEALSRVRHRGAVAADHRTGDGAGVLLPLPAALLPEPGLGLAMVFLRGPDARRAVEEACRAEGIAVRSWRA